VKRMLSVIVNPNRYRSKASEAFFEKILPQFSNFRLLQEEAVGGLGKVDASEERHSPEPKESLSL
jgi:hypothetical protein